MPAPLWPRWRNPVELTLTISDPTAAGSTSRESTAWFRSAFETANHGVAIVGLDGRFLEVNRVTAAVLGYSREELLRLNYRPIVHPDDWALHEASMRTLMSGSAPSFTAEQRHLHADGRTLSVQVTVALICDAVRQPLYCVFQILDITPQIRQMATLQAYREQLELALQSAGATYWEVDLTNMTYTANIEYSAILGYGPDGTSRKIEEWLALIHPDDRELVRRHFAQPDRSDVDHKFELRIKSKTGEWRWFMSHYRVCAFDASGRPLRMRGVDFDISRQKEQAAELQTYRERLALALEAGSASNWEYDMVSKTHSPAPEYLASLGYGARAGVQDTEAWLAHVHPDDVGGFHQSYVLPRNDEATHRYEYRVKSQNGTWRWHLNQFRACAYDALGWPTRLSGMDFDITEQKQQQAALLEAQARISEAASRAKIVFWRHDRGSQFSVWSKDANKLLRLSPDEMPTTAEAYLTMVHKDDAERMRAAYVQVREQGRGFELEYRIARSDGAITWLREIGAVSEGTVDDDVSFVGSLQDITETKTLEAKLALLATVDELTGVHNRRAILAQAQVELRRSLRSNRTLAFLFLDIDNFKQVNDRHGHKMGDTVLTGFCGICRNALRPSDLLGRLGGEEFLVLLPETTLNQAVIVAERLIAHVRATAFSVELPARSITTSAGLTAIRGPGDTIEAALERMDRALYRAKELGRDRIEIQI